MSDPKIKYDIEAAVKGEADADKLAASLRNVGDALEGDLQKSALDAAQALEALSAKQRALDDFARLKTEARDMAAALEAATRVVDTLGNELPQASANTRALADAEAALTAKLADAQASLARKKEALKQLRDETAGAARRTDEYTTAEAGLKAAIAATAADIKTRKTDLVSTTQGLGAAKAAEAALTKEYTLAKDAAAKASAEVGNYNRKLDESRATLAAAKLSTTDLAQSKRNLQAAVAQVREQVATMAPAYQRAAEASSTATRVQAQNQRTLREGMTSISTQLQNIQQIATVALGGSYAGGLAKSAADTADEFKNLQARVKLATGEGQGFQDTWANIAATALATNSALANTSNLFARLSKAAAEGGASAVDAQQRALALTNTINQAVQLSGSSAAASDAAIAQLIQGLQSGVLRGEEFNSVMEQAPRLAQAMANGLGVNTGKLRDMATQGQLTADVVMKALQNQSAVVEKEFGQLPVTVGRALQNLTTSWTLYVGASDNGMLSSANAASAINLLAQNLDGLVTTLSTAGKLWAAIKVAGLAADFGRWATTTLTATAAVEANTLATATNTAAQTANAATHAQHAATQAAATAATAANTAATAANTAAKTANAAAWAQMATFTGQATAAATAATAATAAGTAATVAKTAQLGLLGRAVSGVTGLLGGPVGLAATALLFSSEIKAGIVSVAEWAASLTDAGQRGKEAEQKLKELAAAEKAAAQARAETTQATKLAQAEQAGLTAGMTLQIAKFDELRRAGKSADEAIAAIGKDFDLATLPGINNAAGVLNGLAQQGKLTAREFEDAWAAALSGKDLTAFEVNARTAFQTAADAAKKAFADMQASGTASTEALQAAAQKAAAAQEAAATKTAQTHDAVLRESIRRLGPEYELLAGVVSQTSAQSLNATDTLINGLDRLKAQGVDTAAALTASLGKGIDTANTQQALDAVKAQIEAVRSVLGNKVADGLLQQAATAADVLKKKLEDATPGIQSVAEAMRQLGITSDASLKQTAAESEKAYKTLKDAGTSSAREVAAGFVKAAQDAINANNGVAPSWVKAQAAAAGYKVVVDELGQSTLVKVKTATDGLNGSLGNNAAAYSAAAAAAREWAEAQSTAGAAARAAKLSDAELEADLSGDKYGNRPGGLPARNAALSEDYKRRKAKGQDADGNSVDPLTGQKYEATGTDKGSMLVKLAAMGYDPKDPAVQRAAESVAATVTSQLNSYTGIGFSGGGSSKTVEQQLQQAMESTRYVANTGTNQPERPKTATPGAGPAKATAPATSAASPAPTTPAKTYNVTFNGKTVKTASDADAKALMAMLQNASRTA